MSPAGKNIINKKALEAAKEDAEKGAAAVGLIYVSDSQPGFSRRRKGKVFLYFDKKLELTDKIQIERIRKLRIPPAWEDVWICKMAEGHLQATGYDRLKRKQYLYHSLWVELRNSTKFHRLEEFAEVLPVIRKTLDRHLSLKGLQQDKIMAAVVSLLDRASIRVGSSIYEKLYGSFGLSTLKNRHVKVSGAKLDISFKGKKGIRRKVSLRSKRLARIIKGCKEIPGQELFSWYDEQGEVRNIDSGMVNDYIRRVSAREFTAKDFRTWAGSVQALLAFKQTGGYDTKTEMKRKIPEAIDLVSAHLGNTRAVSRKYYIHPLIIKLYEEKKLEKYLEEIENNEEQDLPYGFSKEEKVLLKILKSEK